MGFGTLKERMDCEEPNKSLHWSPELPRILYPSFTISFLFSDLNIVANFPWSSEVLDNMRSMGFSKTLWSQRKTMSWNRSFNVFNHMAWSLDKGKVKLIIRKCNIVFSHLLFITQPWMLYADTIISLGP